MKRAEFEHAIRAAGSILGTSELMVIGSQAIQATIEGELPQAAQRSIEVDVVAFEDPDGSKADLIDGSIDQFIKFIGAGEQIHAEGKWAPPDSSRTFC